MQSRHRIITQKRFWDFVQPALDAASVMASLAVVQWCSGRSVDDVTLALGLVTVIVFLLLSQLTGLQRQADSSSVDSEVTNVAVTWTVTVMAMAMLGFLTRYGNEFPRSVMIAWFVVTPSVIGLGRMCLRLVQQGMLRRGVGIRRVAIAGLNDLGKRTYSNIDENPSLGMQLVGFFDDRGEQRDPNDEEFVEVTKSGNFQDMIDAARRGEIDTVLITLPMRAEARIRQILDQLSDSTASVYIVPDFFVFELLHSRWTNMGGLPAVSVFENPLYGVDGVVKRVADLVLAVLALIVGAIPMLIIALGVKLTSPGPVFFRQRRYGLDGREILVWKFRSMRTCDNGPVVRQATKDDPRITKLGGILRKTSLDELPQLFNVIEGNMSLVGPRPHASAHNEEYRGRIRGYMLRHKVKPGITGLAQVNGCRGETETIDKMERRIEWDHKYIRSWSIWLDLKILIQTVLVVWKQDEAY